jgi:hypothetical protein
MLELDEGRHVVYCKVSWLDPNSSTDDNRLVELLSSKHERHVYCCSKGVAFQYA